VARALWLWWKRGRLSLFVSLISWVQSQGYIYICSALLGIEVLARVAAARLLFAPLATVLAAWAKGATTRNAELYRQREFAALTRHLVRATIGFALLTLGWCGLILFLQGLLLDVVFKGKYNGMTALIIAWGLTSVVNAWGTIWRLSLRVAANYLSLTRVAMVGAGTSVLIALAAMQWYGEIGAVIGLAAGEAVMALIAVTVFRRSVVRATARAV
jgi:O-antigen/teichoic acid export membrane protein